MGEQAFEYRLTKILEKKGYLCINCTASRPFDLVAAKDGFVFFIELKGRNTPFPEEQRQRQIGLSKKFAIEYVVIRQSKHMGKIELEAYHYGTLMTKSLIEKDLKEKISQPT